jgi:sugar transferase (PEP-CTERM/EpsH1 system associated)
VRDLLFLAHRIPFPPDKGDKIRSWQMFCYLATRYRVHLGCFIDDPWDWRYEAELRAQCGQCWIGGLDKRSAKLRSLAGLARGEALTLGYYRDRALARWVRALVAERGVERVFAYSSSMAQYVLAPWAGRARRVFDFVDVDSDKWAQYAEGRAFPATWFYGREARRLLAFERAAAARSDATLFVSEAEAALFRRLAPEAADRVHALRNGVDFGFFNPDASYPNPFPEGVRAIVFTGAMDYWANADAVAWFTRDVLPLVRRDRPDATFWIVGANPAPEVRALAAVPGVTVTGRVPDVRPYLAHAALVAAPLRLARGIQNKVLEAMAMAKIVVATPQAAEGIDATPGRDLLVADGDAALAAATRSALDDANGEAGRAIGARARALIVAEYGWESALAGLADVLEPPGGYDRIGTVTERSGTL